MIFGGGRGGKRRGGRRVSDSGSRGGGSPCVGDGSRRCRGVGNAGGRGDGSRRVRVPPEARKGEAKPGTSSVPTRGDGTDSHRKHPCAMEPVEGGANRALRELLRNIVHTRCW